MTDSRKTRSHCRWRSPRDLPIENALGEKTLLRPALQKSPERSPSYNDFRHPIERIYTPGDLAVMDPVRELGVPESHLHRGIHHRCIAAIVDHASFAGFGSAEDTNRRSGTCLSRGQNGISVAFDLPR